MYKTAYKQIKSMNREYQSKGVGESFQRQNISIAS